MRLMTPMTPMTPVINTQVASEARAIQQLPAAMTDWKPQLSPSQSHWPSQSRAGYRIHRMEMAAFRDSARPHTRAALAPVTGRGVR
jgi:hypothetical protein